MQRTRALQRNLVNKVSHREHNSQRSEGSLGTASTTAPNFERVRSQASIGFEPNNLPTEMPACPSLPSGCLDELVEKFQALSLEDGEKEIEMMGLDEADAGMVSGEGSLVHPSKSQCTISLGMDFGQVTILAYQLVGHDPIHSFAENCDKTMGEWMALLGKTTLPSDIASSDPRIIVAFQAVDGVLCGQGTYLLRRLAYVQLMRLFVFLEAVIKSERESGRLHRKPCYRDTTVAIDVYMNAQERRSNTSALRRELQERKRFGRSWSDLAGPSPLFVLVYSDAAEPIVYMTFCPYPLFLMLSISKEEL